MTPVDGLARMRMVAALQLQPACWQSGGGGGGALSRDGNIWSASFDHDHQGQPKQATQTAIINCRSSAGGGQTGREAQSGTRMRR